MPGSVRVVEDAEVERPPSRRASGGWLLVGGSFLVGLIAGAVFFSPSLTPPPQTTPEDVTPTPPPIPTGESEPLGLAEAVDGIEDALVAVIRSPTGIDYLLWPIARGPSTRAIPAAEGENVTIDPTGVWIATMTDVPDAAGDLLSLGRSTSVRPVISDVDSYAWHESAPGILGFLKQEEGIWGLYEATVFPVPSLLYEVGASDPGTLVAFGSWGFALQRARDVELIGDQGRRTIPGSLLDTREGAFLAYDSGRVLVVEDTRTSIVLEQPAVQAGAFSPDGSKLAILDSGGLTVVDRSGRLLASRMSLSPQSPQLVWAGERFLIVPSSPRGVRIVDLETGEMTLHLSEYTVYWAGIIPLSGSS